MLRALTGVAVLLLVACGGGGGGGTPPGTASFLEYWPIQDVPDGRSYVYVVTKVLVRGGVQVDQKTGLERSFDVTHVPMPPGETQHVVSGSAFFELSDRGLELAAALGIQFGGDTNWLCVTATSPGILVAPADFQVGQTHTCTEPTGLVTSASLTWVGPEAVAGHPDAHRFDFSVTANYSGSNPNRVGATTVVVTGTFYADPGVGPVSGTAVQEYRDGATVIEASTYTFTLDRFEPPV